MSRPLLSILSPLSLSHVLTLAPIAAADEEELFRLPSPSPPRVAELAGPRPLAFNSRSSLLHQRARQRPSHGPTGTPRAVDTARLRRSYSDPSWLTLEDRTSIHEELIKRSAESGQRTATAAASDAHSSHHSRLHVHRLSLPEDDAEAVISVGRAWLESHTHTRPPTPPAHLDDQRENDSEQLPRSNSSLLAESLARAASRTPCRKHTSQSHTPQSQASTPARSLTTIRSPSSSPSRSLTTSPAFHYQHNIHTALTLPAGFISLYDLLYDLIHSQYGNREARETFLLCLSHFTEPGIVADILMQFLFTEPPFQHARILSFLQQWLQQFPNDLVSLTGRLIGRLSQFPPSHWKRPYSIQMKHLSESLIASLQGLAHTAQHPPPPRPMTSVSDECDDIDSEPLSLYLYSSKLIAQQVTLLTLQRFCLITPRSLMRQHRLSLPDDRNQMKLSNAVSLYISTEVLLANDSRSRLDVYRKWLRIATILYSLRNLNGVFEVLCGLTHHSVYRLRLFESLTRVESNNYDTLCRFVSSDGNYGLYRRIHNALHEQTVTERSQGVATLCLPYLGVLMKDVVAMEECQLGIRIKCHRKCAVSFPSLHLAGSMTPRAGASAGTAQSANASHCTTVNSQASTTALASSSSSGLSLASLNTPAQSSISSLASSVESIHELEDDLFGDDCDGSLVLPKQLVTFTQSLTSVISADPQRVAINFRQCREIHALIHTTLPPQCASYPFTAHPEIQRLIIDGQQHALEDRELMERSMQIKPRAVTAPVKQRSWFHRNIVSHS